MPRVLIADDNSNIQKMAALALKDAGIDVVAVANGEAAVRKLAEFAPDLILADIFMPVRSGYEVCEYVKLDPRFSQTPVVLLVGAYDPFDEREAQRVHADGVLKKPFVPPDPLINMVKTLLAKVASEREAEEAALVTVPSTVPSYPRGPAAPQPDASRDTTHLRTTVIPAVRPFSPPVAAFADISSPEFAMPGASLSDPVPFVAHDAVPFVTQERLPSVASAPESSISDDADAVSTPSRDPSLGEPAFWTRSPDAEDLPLAEPAMEEITEEHTWAPEQPPATEYTEMLPLIDSVLDSAVESPAGLIGDASANDSVAESTMPPPTTAESAGMAAALELMPAIDLLTALEVETWGGESAATSAPHEVADRNHPEDSVAETDSGPAGFAAAFDALTEAPPSGPSPEEQDIASIEPVEMHAAEVEALAIERIDAQPIESLEPSVSAEDATSPSTAPASHDAVPYFTPISEAPVNAAVTEHSAPDRSLVQALVPPSLPGTEGQTTEPSPANLEHEEERAAEFSVDARSKSRIGSRFGKVLDSWFSVLSKTETHPRPASREESSAPESTAGSKAISHASGVDVPAAPDLAEAPVLSIASGNGDIDAPRGALESDESIVVAHEVSNDPAREVPQAPVPAKWAPAIGSDLRHPVEDVPSAVKTSAAQTLESAFVAFYRKGLRAAETGVNAAEPQASAPPLAPAEPPESFAQLQIVPSAGSPAMPSLAMNGRALLMADEIEGIVTRIVDRMQPQIVEVLTREILRPIVDALVRREIEKH